MGDLFQPWHIVIVLFILGGGLLLFLIPGIFYVLTLQKALNKCAPEARTIQPGLLWLFLIPLVNLVLNFFIVFGMANSLRNEFYRRGTPLPDPNPGQNLGLPMAICACCGFIPIIGMVAGIAYLVLWIMYWVKMAEFSRLLDTQFAPPPTPAPAI